MIKIYMIYLKKTGSVYGWTKNRSLALQFIFTRDIKTFKMKKVKKTEEEFSQFLDFNRDKELTNIYLYDGNTDIDIVGTNKEERELEIAIDLITQKIEESVSKLNSFLTVDEINKIKQLTVLFNNNKLMINSFKLFYELFIYTFEKMDFIPFEQQLNTLI